MLMEQAHRRLQTSDWTSGPTVHTLGNSLQNQIVELNVDNNGSIRGPVFYENAVQMREHALSTDCPESATNTSTTTNCMVRFNATSFVPVRQLPGATIILEYGQNPVPTTHADSI
ncbi:hypothetical protein D917_02868 [Trichinella nativa]|nr:hypothetical protein D917_02868 [Trichinella nativa]